MGGWVGGVAFCNQKNVDNTQQYFTFTPVLPIIFKVMGSNPGYVLKSFLLYIIAIVRLMIIKLKIFIQY